MKNSNKTKIIFYFILIFLTSILNAQVGINSDNTPPHPSAQLDVKSANKGLLLPRVTAPATSIAGPTAGLMVFDQSNTNLAYYNGAQWSNLTGTAGNQGLYSRFPNSKGFEGLYIISNSTFDYDFVVPAGVTKVWIEAWCGGLAGSPVSNNPVGGASGDFASFLLPVIPGNTMEIKVSQGNGSLTSIYPLKGAAEYIRILYGGDGIFKTANINLELINFFGGEGYTNSSLSFQNWAGTDVYLVSGADGGGSYPNYKRAKSQTFVYNAITNALITTQGFYNRGTNPGGGGTTGSDRGAPGLVIMHW